MEDNVPHRRLKETLSQVIKRSRTVTSLAGPALIVVGVLLVLRHFAFRDLLTVGDVRTLWLPTYCFLGENLVNGHIPGWNPHVMAGVPFAADPQSGWMYLPPTILFTVFSCSIAIRLMIVLQPMLAGIGLYWFLRGEDISRPASTVGGLSLALGLAASKVPLAIPFSASLAWTALILAAASRYLRSTEWPKRLLWLLLTALAWGQLAAAHLSVGVLMGTVALGLYVAGSVWARRVSRPALAVGLLVVSLPILNLAYLLPRLAYVGKTSLGLGYLGLERLAERFGDHGIIPEPIATGPVWPLKLGTSPGVFLGAVTLGLAFAAWWHPRYRRMAAAFSVLGAVSYILGLEAVADVIPESFRSNRIFDFYLHNPYWTVFQLILALSVLGAVGLEAWREAGSWRTRMKMVAPGVVTWGVMPILFGASASQLLIPAIGAAVGATLLIASTQWNPLWVAIPVLVAVELTANGIVPPATTMPFGPPPSLGEITPPTVKLPHYLRPGPIYGSLRGSDGRYATVGPGKVFDRTTNKSTLFGTESVDAYNAVQSRRYWSFVRALQRPSIKYNRAYFERRSRIAFDLLQVNWTVRGRAVRLGPSHRRPREPINENDGTLSRQRRLEARAEFSRSWSVVTNDDEALRVVTDRRFDPSRGMVLERDPGVARSAGPRAAGEAVFRWTGNQSARIDVRAPADGVVLIRNAYDDHWHATVDGRPAAVLAANYVIQAVPVRRGMHTVELTYDDPWIGYGVLGSVFSISALLATAAWWSRRRQRY
jgi:hypothetical protein